jgi:hypothetical protein
MRTAPDPAALARLPRWARDYITHLERRADEARRDLDTLACAPIPEAEAPQGLYFGAYGDHGWTYRQVPRYSHMVALLGPPGRDQSRLQVKIGTYWATGQAPVLHVYSAGYGALVALPESTNRLSLYPLDLRR